MTSEQKTDPLPVQPEDNQKPPEPDAPVQRKRHRRASDPGSAETLPAAKPRGRPVVRNREPTGDFVPDRVMLTIKEAAAASGVTEFFLRGQIKAGKIRVSAFSEFIVRILPEELVSWAERARTELDVVRDIVEPPTVVDGEEPSKG